MRRGRPRIFTPRELLFLALLGCLACVSLGSLAVWMGIASAEKTFKERAVSIQRDFAHRFGSTEAVLTALVGLHHASDNLKAYESSALSRELLLAYPYIRTIAEIRAVAAHERDQFERYMRTGGFADFRVSERWIGKLVPAGNRPITMPIRSFEPLEPEAAALVGFDIFSDWYLRDAAEAAIESGNIAASAPVMLPNVGRVFLVFKAIYRGNNLPDTPGARKANVSGMVALFLNPDDMFRSFQDNYPELSFRLMSRSATDTESEQLISAHRLKAPDGIGSLLTPFASSVTVNAYGKTFVLDVTSYINTGTIRGWPIVLFVLMGATAFGLLTVALAIRRMSAVRAQEGERILRENQERFRDYAEIASDWFWATDSGLRFSYVSKDLAKSSALRTGFTLGATVKEQFASDPANEALRQHLADLEARRPFRNFRYRDVDDAGNLRWWSVSGKPVVEENGEFIGYRGTGRDVTTEVEARKSLQTSKEQAELASRAKSEFIANMSHELRTPLNAIIGFSQVMVGQMFGPLAGKYRGYASDIHSSGLHLLALINDILDLSKVESGNEELREDEVDLPKLMNSLMTLMRHHAEKGEVSLVVDCDGDTLPRIWADERKLKQVLVNLLSNAIKFTRTGGAVTLAAKCDRGEGCVFRISDTGIGMSDEDIPRAFSKFGQIDSDLNRKFEGTGLGLPLAKALTELHGGSLVLTSVLGSGTVATVRLPASRILWPNAPRAHGPRSTPMPAKEVRRLQARG